MTHIIKPPPCLPPAPLFKSNLLVFPIKCGLNGYKQNTKLVIEENTFDNFSTVDIFLLVMTVFPTTDLFLIKMDFNFAAGILLILVAVSVRF
jgi:hypothetical protein